MYINCIIRSSTGVARITSQHEVGDRKLTASIMRFSPFAISRETATLEIQAINWSTLSIFQKKDIY